MMLKPKVLIVEDEVLVSLDISKRLEKVGFEITNRAENGQDAILSFKDSKPDIVILDINLDGDLDGIETAKKIGELFTLPIIYLTSYSDDATFKRAQETSPSAYLLKPFNERELHLAIELAIANFSRFRKAQNPLEKLESPNEEYYLLQDSIFLKRKTRFEKVLIESISIVEADGNCTHIRTQSKKYFLSITMGKILSDLSLPHIVRCHRSYAVNLRAIDSFEGNMIFVDGKEIPVSKSYKEDFFNRLKTI